MNKFRDNEPDKQTAASGESGPIRILIADDHALMRQAVIGLLQSQKDLNVVAQAVNGCEAVRLAKELKPRVVLMDVSMPEMNGFDATAHIRNDSGDIRIIGLSMHNDSHTMQNMLDAGASAFLVKTDLSSNLAQIIRRVAL
jgi:DNA-binding NarL/FixJ family response regulator